MYDLHQPPKKNESSIETEETMSSQEHFHSSIIPV